jgi:purine-binding chemotaxis protein CheW
MEKQLVVFELANELFGVDIGAVESIIKMQTITRVPQSPEFVEGVINLRGKVLPVIDLRLRFGLPAVEVTKSNRIMVVSIDGSEVGMIVDGVSEVLSISDGDVEPPPAMATTVNSTFIVGIAKIDTRLVILLDLKKILSLEEQASLAA